MVRGRYGEFKVLVDGKTVVDGGALAALGVLPSGRKVLDAVRATLSAMAAGQDRQTLGDCSLPISSRRRPRILAPRDKANSKLNIGIFARG